MSDPAATAPTGPVPGPPLGDVPAASGTGPSLRWRLLGAMALVVLAGAGTLFLVAFVVAPSVFYRHLQEAGVTPTGEVAMHVDRGFTTALVSGVAGGVLAATVVAVAVAVLVARRITAPVIATAATATRLAAGDYGVRLDPPRMGPELAELADAVNTLAARLEATAAARLRLVQDLRHELRTPLTSLEATVEAVTDGVLPVDAVTLATLTEQTARLARLVDDLAAVSRADEHAFSVTAERVDLTAKAEAAVHAARARYAVADVALALEAEGPVPAVADPQRVSEILDQLLDNALKHSPRGTEVTIRTTGRPGSATVSVVDTGRGFPPEEAEALFDRFHRHDPDATTGTGVGLTIARALARAMQGTLAASSAGPGRGASFTLTLPAPDRSR